MISIPRQHLPNRAVPVSVALLVALLSYHATSHGPTETSLETSTPILTHPSSNALPAIEESRPVRDDAYLQVADRHPPLGEQSPGPDIAGETLAVVEAPRVEQAADPADLQAVETSVPIVKVAALVPPVITAAKAQVKEASPARATITEPAPTVEKLLEETKQVESLPAVKKSPETEVARAQMIEPAGAESQPPAMSIVTAPVAATTTRFQRLNGRGEAVTADEPWSCVRDNRSDLVWEVKTSDGGLHDARHLYSWFDPSLATDPGVRDGGRCAGGVDCDTHAYQLELNRQGLCGLDDWRLPSKQELQTLVVLGNRGKQATIDSDYFPGTAASWYWTASSNETRPRYAWYVLFRNGIPLNDLKERPKHLRLVSGTRLIMASSN